MKRLLMTAIWMAGSLAAQSAATTSSIQERGKKIVAESLAALGGEKFLAIHDMVQHGRLYSFYREQMNGMARARIYTRFRTPSGPNDLGQRERQSFGKDKEVYANLFTEEEALEVTFRGVRPFPRDQYERYKDSAMRNIFYILRHRRDEPGLIMEYRESTTFENVPVEIVDLTDSENRVVTVYFNRTTKLPLRQVYKRRDPEYKRLVDEVTIFNKYRDTGGVQWPWSIVRYRDGDKMFEMYAEQVELNPKLDDKLFSPPADAKRLKP